RVVDRRGAHRRARVARRVPRRRHRRRCGRGRDARLVAHVAGGPPGAPVRRARARGSHGRRAGPRRARRRGGGRGGRAVGPALRRLRWPYAPRVAESGTPAVPVPLDAVAALGAPLGALVEAVRLEGGYFATSYRVTLDDGTRVVVKTAPTDT